MWGLWCKRTPYKTNLEEWAGEYQPSIVGKPINLTWLEWLMGFPLGHTDLEPSETP